MPHDPTDLVDEIIFISVTEAARILGSSFKPWEVYELCKAGEIECQYHGNVLLIRPAAVQAYADRLPSEAVSA